MSLRITLALTLACVSFVLLSGCDNVHTPLEQRTSAIVDMGSKPLPNSPYHLHGYRLDNGTNHDHFVYVIEDSENRLLAGVQSNQTREDGQVQQERVDSLPGVGRFRHGQR